jgi:hypothetical protein
LPVLIKVAILQVRVVPGPHFELVFFFGNCDVDSGAFETMAMLGTVIGVHYVDCPVTFVETFFDEW